MLSGIQLYESTQISDLGCGKLHVKQVELWEPVTDAKLEGKKAGNKRTFKSLILPTVLPDHVDTTLRLFLFIGFY